ncbi:hypothetical protein Leryth_021429 [Lithospermum erythrorhizon]|nr:hypothetical protein Leryth_021429 [Lithospermum erythrorhizon]
MQSSIKDDQDGLCALMVQTQVTTKDGYILSMQRIPQGRASNVKTQNNGLPVLLQHGLSSDAGTWLSPPTNEALGFVLADAGYDVWLSNSRATNYSTAHTSLSPSDSGTLMALAAFSQGNVFNMLRSAALLSPIAYLGQIRSGLAKAAADAFIASIEPLLTLRTHGYYVMTPILTEQLIHQHTEILDQNY